MVQFCEKKEFSKKKWVYNKENKKKVLVLNRCQRVTTELHENDEKYLKRVFFLILKQVKKTGHHLLSFFMMKKSHLQIVDLNEICFCSSSSNLCNQKVIVAGFKCYLILVKV